MRITNSVVRKRVRFLRALEQGMTIGEAVKAAGAGRRTIYRWREHDETFRRAWDRSIDRGTTILEDVALERALDKSDTLLIFLLKSRRPDLYSERKVVTGDLNHTHTGQIGLSQSAEWLADILGGDEEGASTEPLH